MVEHSQDGRKEAFVPEGVLKGVGDIAEGRTLSDEELDEVLKF